MPAEKKTPFLSLNDYYPEDRGKWADIAEDNRKVDSAIKTLDTTFTDTSKDLYAQLSEKAQISAQNSVNWDSGNFRVESGSWTPFVFNVANSERIQLSSTTWGYYTIHGKILFLTCNIIFEDIPSVQASISIGGLPVSCTKQGSATIHNYYLWNSDVIAIGGSLHGNTIGLYAYGKTGYVGYMHTKYITNSKTTLLVTGTYNIA